MKYIHLDNLCSKLRLTYLLKRVYITLGNNLDCNLGNKRKKKLITQIINYITYRATCGVLPENIINSHQKNIRLKYSSTKMFFFFGRLVPGEFRNYFEPFSAQGRKINSPFWTPYICCNVTFENLVVLSRQYLQLRISHVIQCYSMCHLSPLRHWPFGSNEL